MTHFLAVFGSALGTTIVLDGLWLGVIATRFYSRELGSLVRRSATGLDPIWLPAILVWIVIPLGITLFAVPRANGDPLLGLAWGALFGLVLYAVYDLTNLSLIQGWSLRMTITDILWGATLCGIATFVATLVGKTVS